MRFKIFSILCLAAALFTALSAEAFNKDRCGTLFPKSDDWHPPYYSPLYVTTMVPSTTSYFSSIGPCAMYSNNRVVSRQAFVETSHAQLQTDVAQGKGEYLNTLAELSGCPVAQYDNFGAVLQNRFSSLFSDYVNETDLLQKVDAAVRADHRLRHHCAVPL